MGWACRGGAQSFQQYPLEMHSPRGGGVGEAKPWLSSCSPLDTFCYCQQWIHAQVNLPMLPVSSRGGQGARWPVPDSSRSEFCAFGGHCQQ